jgi:hypothetical protein
VLTSCLPASKPVPANSTQAIEKDGGRDWD